MYEMCPKILYLAILAYFRIPTPPKSPLHYQESTFKGSYSPKSLSKLVLLENGFISILFEAKILYFHISLFLANFWDQMTH